jgi:hypothetical protein
MVALCSANDLRNVAFSEGKTTLWAIASLECATLLLLDAKPREPCDVVMEFHTGYICTQRSGTRARPHPGNSAIE